MRKVSPQTDWPQSWHTIYAYDLLEIYGSNSNPGYVSGYNARRQMTLTWLLESLPRGASLLDAAAAQGNFSLAAAELGYDVTWADLRSELIPYVQQKYEHGKLTYLPGNLFDLPPEPTYDGILMTEVIEHVAHPDQFLRQMGRLLRPGGLALMTTPNGRYFLNNLPRFTDTRDPAIFESAQFQPNADGHIFLLHPDEIAPLAAAAGLTVERLEHFCNPLTSGHLKLRHLLKLMPARLVACIEHLTRRLPAVVSTRILSHTICQMRNAAAV